MRSRRVIFFSAFLLLALLGVVFFVVFFVRGIHQETMSISESNNTIVSNNVQTEKETEKTFLPTPPDSYEIPGRLHVGQTFNNCGPASLSMQLSYFDINVTQQELGQKLRPYQNPQGDNDDKTVTIEELAEEAKNYGLTPYYRANADIELIKYFISNDIPIMVRTWLHPNEDIGHYRIVRGYDDTTREIIQDDSYEGKNLRYSYDEFFSMWQPFNYTYMVLVPEEKRELVETILGEEVDQKTSWKNALIRAQEEKQQDPTNPYPSFNIATASYYLGDYQTAVKSYEEVRNQLPNRMLWYQIEPIRAYVLTGNHNTAISIADSVINNNNRGFSEMYVIKGMAYEEQGKVSEARTEYEKALQYNPNYKEAQELLMTVR